MMTMAEDVLNTPKLTELAEEWEEVRRDWGQCDLSTLADGEWVSQIGTRYIVWRYPLKK